MVGSRYEYHAAKRESFVCRLGKWDVWVWLTPSGGQYLTFTDGVTHVVFSLKTERRIAGWAENVTPEIAAYLALKYGVSI